MTFGFAAKGLALPEFLHFVFPSSPHLACSLPARAPPQFGLASSPRRSALKHHTRSYYTLSHRHAAPTVSIMAHCYQTRFPLSLLPPPSTWQSWNAAASKSHRNLPRPCRRIKWSSHSRTPSSKFRVRRALVHRNPALAAAASRFCGAGKGPRIRDGHCIILHSARRSVRLAHLDGICMLLRSATEFETRFAACSRVWARRPAPPATRARRNIGHWLPSGYRR